MQQLRALDCVLFVYYSQKISVSVKHQMSVKILNHQTEFCGIHWTDFDQTHSTVRLQMSAVSFEFCPLSFVVGDMLSYFFISFAIKSPLDYEAVFDHCFKQRLLKLS